MREAFALPKQEQQCIDKLGILGKWQLRRENPTTLTKSRGRVEMAYVRGSFSRTIPEKCCRVM